MQYFNTPVDFLASERAKEIQRKYEYLFSYSNNHTYHPFHAMSMISGGAVPNLYASSVYIVGAKLPKYARGMGFKAVGSVEEALKYAKKYVGVNPKNLATPCCFTSGTAVNLHLKK